LAVCRRRTASSTDMRPHRVRRAAAQVNVRKATAEVYAATIDDKIAMKIGPGSWEPANSNLHGYKKAASGHQFAVWEVAT